MIDVSFYKSYLYDGFFDNSLKVTHNMSTIQVRNPRTGEN